MSRRAAFFALALAPVAGWAQPAYVVPPHEAIGDAAARVALAEAYVGLGRFEDARRLYDAGLDQMDAPDATLLVRAGDMRLYLGRAAEALPYYRRALVADPDHAAARRALALALAWTGSAAEARPMLERLARENPADAEVGRVFAELAAGDAEGSGRTLDLLRERVARDPGSAAAKADLAEFEATRGHAVAAAALYAEARRIQNPVTGDSFDLRHARARLTWGDFYPAEAAVRAALAKDPANADLNTMLAGLLVSMDRLERAEADALLWLARDPGSEKARAALLDARRKLRWEPSAPPVPPGAGSLAERFHAAGAEGTRREEFVRAHVGEESDAPPPATAPELNELAGLYAGQGDFELAVRCLRAARRADPEFFPAWIGLAEFLAIAGSYEEAHREFDALAAVFPENRQVMLKRARALGWARRYEDSLAAYAALRALNPADPVPLLEQARVAGWAKERDRSAELYADRWAEPVDARLFDGLRPLLLGVDRDHPTLLAWQDILAREEGATHEEPFHFTERFEVDFPSLVAAVPPDRADEILALRLALRADFHLQRAFWLENRAKQLAWDRRWWRSEETYERLLAAAPANQEALFDLSQVQAAQGLGDREHATLGRLLEIDANNRLAAHARFRRERRSEPLAYGEWQYYRERGRDSLSDIERSRLALGGETMIDHRFTVGAAVLDWRERPAGLSGGARARGFTVGAGGVFSNRLAASADYTHKDYAQSGIGSVDTGGARAWLSFRDAFRVGAGVEVMEELANVFAYRQGIRSTRGWLGAEAALSRRAEIAARAESFDYADDNGGSHLMIAPAYSWTDHPRTFKTTLTLEARDTDKANIYQFAGPTLVNIVHPYWTPQDYRGAALTLEWRHDLAREFFSGAQEHWYDVRVTFGASNDDNRGVAWAADYVREWSDRWVLRLGVGQTFSKQWDDLRAQARLAFRF